jgi:hypothetical protein
LDDLLLSHLIPLFLLRPHNLVLLLLLLLVSYLELREEFGISLRGQFSLLQDFKVCHANPYLESIVLVVEQ